MGYQEIVNKIFLQAMEEMKYVPNKEKRLPPQKKQFQWTLSIDFHGMNVKKALVKLEVVLTEYSPVRQRLYLIVGQGKHSSAIFSPLRQAIEKFLEEKGIVYTYEEGVIKI